MPVQNASIGLDRLAVKLLFQNTIQSPEATPGPFDLEEVEALLEALSGWKVRMTEEKRRAEEKIAEAKALAAQKEREATVVSSEEVALAPTERSKMPAPAPAPAKTVSNPAKRPAATKFAPPKKKKKKKGLSYAKV